jgi:hypothetical protein
VYAGDEGTKVTKVTEARPLLEKLPYRTINAFSEIPYLVVFVFIYLFH